MQSARPKYTTEAEAAAVAVVAVPMAPPPEPPDALTVWETPGQVPVRVRVPAE